MCQYDAYGKLISIQDTTSNNIGEKNPYRYRSYYYDTETSWYYLNSRYYDPLVGRFITMDEIEYLGATSTIQSYNLFTYCEGNPVNMVDPDGQFGIASFVCLLTIVIMIPTVAAIISNYVPKTTPKSNNKGKKDKDKNIIGPDDNWEKANDDFEEADKIRDAASYTDAILTRAQDKYQAQLVMFYQERYGYIDDLDPLW